MSNRGTASLGGRKRFLGGSRARLVAFILGLIFVLGGGIYLSYAYLDLSHWKETKATGVIDSGAQCRIAKYEYGTERIFTYRIDGIEYTHKHCVKEKVVPSFKSTIRYDLNDPSKSQLGAIGTERFAAIAVMVLGVIVLLMAIFTTDTAKDKK